MSEEIRNAVFQAIRNLREDATDISVPDDLSALDKQTPTNLTITWKADEELHMGNFLTWTGDAGGTHEFRVLEALANTEIPVPRLVTAGTSGETAVMLAHQVEGESLASQLANTGMRWEISATAFTYARMLARIHALDWTKVVPWMEDPESLAEDIIDQQVEAEFAERVSRIDEVPEDWRSFVQRVIDWLELRRPVEVSLCLCHGQYWPGNIFSVGEDITAVINWQYASVTDASRDLAMLPVWLNDVGLSMEDAELFAQAVHGAYLQASPRGLANTPYYSVAEPLDQLIYRLIDTENPATDSELDSLKGTVERAMALAGRVPWKNR